MAETTGSDPNAYGGSSQNNTFGNNKFWIQWIEFETSGSVSSLADIGFDLANGDFTPNSGTVGNAVVTQAGGVDTLAVNAIASYIGETTTAGASATELFAARFVSTLTITTAGTYDFSLHSDDGTMIYIDGVPVVNHDGLHDAGPEGVGSVFLDSGPHDVVIIHYNYLGPSQLSLNMTGPDYPSGTTFESIPLSNLQANAGDDVVAGGDGTDVIYGGAGDDALSGGAGADTLYGEAGADTLTGGAGDDTLYGGTGADIFVITSGGGADQAPDFNPAEDRLDTSGLDAAFGRQVTAGDAVVTEDGSGNQIVTFPAGESITLPPGSIDLTTSRSTFDGLVAMGVPACFCPGVRISTPEGPRPVELLRRGDFVDTLHHGPQPLLLAHRRLAPRRAEGRHMPLRIAPGALGAGVPKRALLLSPQHRIALRGGAAPGLPPGEALTPARALLGRAGVRHLTGRPGAVYIALLFARHEVIFAEGAAAESYLPGPVTLSGMSLTEREALLAAAPTLLRGPPAPALPLLTVRQGREALARGALGFGAPAPCPAP